MDIIYIWEVSLLISHQSHREAPMDIYIILILSYHIIVVWAFSTDEPCV